MALSTERKLQVSEVLDKWDNFTTDSFDVSTPYDWRSNALRAMREGNINKMKAEVAPLAEFRVIDIMQNASSEALQLDAAKYLLAQAGHGPVQKVDHNIVYEKMEADQLAAILQSRLAQLQRLAPGLLPQNVVDAEFTTTENGTDENAAE